jgi:D-glycero-D-manno-heptose 1,7-bisphosphate phosphatase
MQPAVFLDRDGVIIEEVHYLSEVRQVRLLPGAARAIAQVNRLGVPVIVVTNQAGVARGKFPEERVHEAHAYLDLLLHRHGARIDRYLYCPHHPEAAVPSYRVACACRKPKPGMLQQAVTELALDPTRSLLVGDKLSDLQAGAATGCATILVRTGHGLAVRATDLVRERLNLVEVMPDLAAALTWWLEHGQDRTGTKAVA